MTNTDCIFCKIVRGEIPCAKVLETDTVLAFLDIAPVNKGHVLLIPKAHHADIWELPAALSPDLMTALRKIALAQKTSLGAEGVNIGMNNGAAAGQLVMHAHWHLIPRFEKDGLSAWPQKAYADHEEMARTARTLSGNIR